MAEQSNASDNNKTFKTVSAEEWINSGTQPEMKHINEFIGFSDASDDDYVAGDDMPVEVQATLIEDDAFAADPQQAAEDAANLKRGKKLLAAVLAVLVIGFATGIIPAIVGFIGSVIFTACFIGICYYLIKGYMKLYNSEFCRKSREKAARKKAEKKARRGGLGLLDIALLSVVEGYSSPAPKSSGPIPPSTPRQEPTTSYSSGVDQDAYYRKKQAEQQAYWHRNQAGNYANGSCQQQYHDNAAARAQYNANNTTYR